MSTEPTRRGHFWRLSHFAPRRLNWRVCRCGHRRGLHDMRLGGRGCAECEMAARRDGTYDNKCMAFRWRWAS